MGLLSGLFGASEADKARELQQKQINATYKYNKQVYNFEQQQAFRQYDFALEGLKIQKENERNLLKYNYKTQLQSARFQQRIQDYQYKSQLKQYAKSEKIYKRQLGFNEMAAYRAAAGEARRMQDVVADQAYQKQELFTQLLEAEGVQMARGVSGKSAAKGMQSAIAQYGRNQAIMADSLMGANREYRNNLQDINMARYGADLAADANRMLKPRELPGVPMPMKAPRSVLQRPLAPMAPPKPIKGVNTAVGGNWAGAIGGSLLSAGASVGALALTSSNPITAPLAIGTFLSNLF